MIGVGFKKLACTPIQKLRECVGPDLGANCLQRSSADNKVATSKEKHKEKKDLPNIGDTTLLGVVETDCVVLAVVCVVVVDFSVVVDCVVGMVAVVVF